MKIVTSDQMREIEARSERAGVPTDALMERAGLEVARRARHHLGHLAGVPITVLVGPGNNGGDGLVAARHLCIWGARVLVYVCLDRREPDHQLSLSRKLDMTVVAASEDEGLERLKEGLASSHLVVDAVLGTGRARPIAGPLKAILGALAEAKSSPWSPRILALDLPTGLDADTGAVDPICPAADITVALGYPKVGLFSQAGAEKVGTLDVVDIGIPTGLDVDIGLALMTSAWARATLPARPSAAHKGTFGRTMVVAGSRDYIGAASLAANAATRVGAGLVTVAVPESLQPAVASRAAEPTYLPLPESSPGVVSPDAAPLILDNLAGYDALLIGCGIGQAPTTRDMVEALLFSDVKLPPTVVDADALNILSSSQGEGDGWRERYTSEAVLTPHPGEMARLTGSCTAAIQDDRISVAMESAAKWNKVTVLKGARTVIASPIGKTVLSPFANPGLASAGTGDVLAGVIAGLLTQGLTLVDAAALGVYLHGTAGERVRRKLGEAGMVAGDLLAELPLSIRDIGRDIGSGQTRLDPVRLH